MEIFFEELQPFNINRDIIESVINKIILNELKEGGSISVIFCHDDYLLDINKQYLNHNYFTDIITFDYTENEIIGGDLFISVDRLKENAKKYDTEFIIELYRVVFHGILHLLGYNDKTNDEKVIMKEKENHYLKEVDFSLF
ncbi:MAG: rRNA maturation RNase YbeY [Prolixibacteraceae bacterium]|nr:rRNA maturation RNase YbeY [Prolixibacteraceae bacterium]MBT6005979.1 rRNA maturation RNase YbeY [Prolixibacteraceae bacterium]MBT6766238.1 rRNA maturation RNase YbeY [Prolixibacteraceae bacterium]MBT7000568.1 rRNA maturation RNase YbeY [Prolixibacteraceae bacterium]MBT7393516.1 rRNA maturation RNase YbeY [Prolixibacteraceae bacterium]